MQSLRSEPQLAPAIAKREVSQQDKVRLLCDACLDRINAIEKTIRADPHGKGEGQLDLWRGLLSEKKAGTHRRALIEAIEELGPAIDIDQAHPIDDYKTPVPMKIIFANTLKSLVACCKARNFQDLQNKWFVFENHMTTLRDYLGVSSEAPLSNTDERATAAHPIVTAALAAASGPHDGLALTAEEVARLLSLDEKLRDTLDLLREMEREVEILNRVRALVSRQTGQALESIDEIAIINHLKKSHQGATAYGHMERVVESGRGNFLPPDRPRSKPGIDKLLALLERGLEGERFDQELQGIYGQPRNEPAQPGTIASLIRRLEKWVNLF